MLADRTANIIHLNPDLKLGEFVCAIGVFDGLHEGHRYIINETIEQARRLQVPAIVITFDRDPDEMFLEPAAQRKLLSNEDRISFLASSGADSVLVIPFNPKLSHREPENFLNAVIGASGIARGIHVGSDFRFGHKAAGIVDDLELWCSDRGCDVFGHDLLTSEGSSVTATRIRNALEEADLALANKLLMRPHYIWAEVISGRSAGRELGFPTANLKIEEYLVCPADGVYSGALIIDGRPYKAAISVGVPVTFSNTTKTIEAHILDFDSDLYGRRLQVFFFEYLREMIGFDTVDELKKTVFHNIEQARASLIPADLLDYPPS